MWQFTWLESVILAVVLLVIVFFMVTAVTVSYRRKEWKKLKQTHVENNVKSREMRASTTIPEFVSFAR